MSHTYSTWKGHQNLRQKWACTMHTQKRKQVFSWLCLTWRYSSTSTCPLWFVSISFKTSWICSPVTFHRPVPGEEHTWRNSASSNLPWVSICISAITEESSSPVKSKCWFCGNPPYELLLLTSLHITRFSINGICHFSVNFFVFRLCLKTKSVLKSLCNLPVEFVIS